MIEGKPDRVYFDSLQGLRALAAILVMIGHIRHEITVTAAKLGESVPGWIMLKLPYNGGVDMFFVLSGFLMIYTAQNLYQKPGGWRVFLKKRFIRIVPLYWFYTSLMIAVMLVLPHAFDTAEVDLWHFIQSYLFIPHERPAGGIKPVLSLGWTLHYEMYFYLIFAALLFCARERLIALIAILFSGLSILNLFLPDDAVLAQFLTRPIIMEFVAGMILAHIYIRGGRLNRIWLPVGFAVAAAIFCLMPTVINIGNYDIHRMPQMIIAILLVTLLTLCKGMDSLIMPRPLKALGDSSYTLYLAHPFGIGAVALLTLQFHLPMAVQFFLSLMVCIIGAYIAYRLIEKPMTDGLKRWT